MIATKLMLKYNTGSLIKNY